MPLSAPPPLPPRVGIGLDDDGGLQRFRMRACQMMATTITIVATAWFCTFGIFPAIIALMVAKHVLVAILLMGLGVDAQRS
jgi:hypothetical protein